jgi:hypothetical protein
MKTLIPNTLRALPILFLLSLAMCSLASLQQTTLQPRPTPKTDKKIYSEPELPKLPRAGGKFFDPTFGTEILRVTDEQSAVEGGTFYSYWPTFNSDNTRLLVRTANDGSAHVYDFDPVSFTLGGRKIIPASPAGYPNVESAVWSGLDPDSLYALVGTKIYAYHPSKGSYSLIADFSREFPGDFLWQLSVSRATDDVFAFARRRTNSSGGSDYVGYGAYSRSQKKLLVNQSIKAKDMDEVQVDKSGRWLVVKGEFQTVGGMSIRDLQNGGARKILRYGPPEYAPGHSDNGSGFVSGFNNYLNTIDRRNFQNPLPITTELSLGKDWSQGIHVSQLANNDNWMLVSLYEVAAVPNPLGPFHNEIILVKTDGSENVVRLLHHRSVYKSYYDTPRANISLDGRFLAFTSNWGGRNRRDMFIALIPELPPPTRPRRTK